MSISRVAQCMMLHLRLLWRVLILVEQLRGLGLPPLRRRHGPPGPDRQQPPRHERPAPVGHAVAQIVNDG